MSNLIKTSIPRRDFLKGAASVLGASMLGAASTSALAESLGTSPANAIAPISLAFLDGKRLVTATKLPMGDSSLSDVKVTIHGFGNGGKISSIDGHAMAIGPRGNQEATYVAWVAPPTGCRQVNFRTPVDHTQGLSLSIHQGTGKQATVTDCMITTNTGRSAKLREGTYVLVGGNVNLESYVYDPLVPGSLTQYGRPVTDQYVIITVQRL